MGFNSGFKGLSHLSSLKERRGRRARGERCDAWTNPCRLHG